ncbi:MAG: orotidine-5'-phosphate decarboxylase [Rectinemataceae bacterium]|jgi:uridine monophosphate synthetase
MNFFNRLEGIVSSKKTCLCIGLDPRVDATLPGAASIVIAENRRIVEATAPYVAAYKPNLAFYEALGPSGLEALEETISFIPDDIPVILDAKRGDIDATAEAYATALFDRLHGDAVTLSPYLGRDAIDPFLKYPDKGIFVLARTSNKSAGQFQDLSVYGSGEALFVKVARECATWSDSIGLVVAGNDIAGLRAVRAAAPRAWFLAPGIGAQGGKADEAFAAGSRSDGMGILIVAARSVAGASDPGAAARELRDTIESARSFASGARANGIRANGIRVSEVPWHNDSLKERFLDSLIATGCFRLGDFTLKSGKKSPFYIDLRRLISDPDAMALAAEAYARTAEGLAYDRIAGIPAAGLPLATATSLRTGRPMVWPRMPAKEHGTGNRIEGDYKPGERLLLLDDLITTGASKLEAAEILRGEGLVVEDLVVLIERGRQGRRDMDAAGIRLKAFVHVRDLFGTCERLNLVDAARRRELEAYVDEE